MSKHALVNVVRVDLVTQDAQPKTYTITDTATECTIETYESEGETTHVRAKNTIIATLETDNIVLGYDITLVDSVLNPEVLALIDGGTWDETDKEYTAPVVGKPVNRKKFDMTIYTEEKDVDGSTIQYVAFTFNDCKGTPVAYSLKDGEFFAPEMLIKSRPAFNSEACSFKILEELPA